MEPVIGTYASVWFRALSILTHISPSVTCLRLDIGGLFDSFMQELQAPEQTIHLDPILQRLTCLQSVEVALRFSDYERGYGLVKVDLLEPVADALRQALPETDRKGILSVVLNGE